MKTSNEMLADIVVKSGAIVRNSDNRNMLLQDWARNTTLDDENELLKAVVSFYGGTPSSNIRNELLEHILLLIGGVVAADNRTDLLSAISAKL